MLLRQIAMFSSKINSIAVKSTIRTILKCDSCIIKQFSSSPSCFKLKEPKSTADESVEVYYGVLTPQIRGVKTFSLMTSTMGVIAQPLLYKQIAEFGGGVPLMVAIGSFIGFFTFVTPFLLHFITKKYVTKIHYYPKQENYSLTTLNFFLRPRTLMFKPNDVEIPDVPGLFTSFTVRGKPVFVDARLFPDPSHYAKIMRFDQPMDFKLGDDSSTAKKK